LLVRLPALTRRPWPRDVRGLRHPVRTMPARLSVTVPLSGLAKVRRAKVSLPLVSALQDDPKYSAELPARQTSRGVDKPQRQPSMRTIMRLARRAETVEERAQPAVLAQSGAARWRRCVR